MDNKPLTEEDMNKIIGYGPLKWDEDEYGYHVQYSSIPNDNPVTLQDLFDFIHNKP